MTRIVGAIAIALSLTACDNRPATVADLKAEAAERRDFDDAAMQEIRILRDRIERLEIDKRMAEKYPAASPIQTAPDDTARLALRAQLKQMTAEGVCGQDPPAPTGTGGVIIRNRECTEKDLR